ncbi:MAG TPA: hypothetical protein PLB81_03760 [Deltaproteobacteria bacterium]|nr:hypothetical protein [Deltaproteobacteria bacterium]
MERKPERKNSESPFMKEEKKLLTGPDQVKILIRTNRKQQRLMKILSAALGLTYNEIFSEAISDYAKKYRAQCLEKSNIDPTTIV